MTALQRFMHSGKLQNAQQKCIAAKNYAGGLIQNCAKHFHK